jgi:sulfate/thiosulfate transport system substrate-binding protein
MRSRLLLSLVALMVLLTAAASLASGAGARGSDVKLSLVAYSTPAAAYTKLIAAFQKTPDGAGVAFTQSYGASGDQQRAVTAGLPADIVNLSLAPDVDALVKAGLVDSKWNRQSYKGMVTDSVVALVLRDGNPKHIKTWNDLLRPGISVITPNPFTSGGARWNVIAAYGSWLKQGRTPAQAKANLVKLFRNVSVQDKSARDALNTFLSGKGDALITYESEAIAAQLKGSKIQYVIPRTTILIENPIAVLKNSSNKDKANQFLRFLRTPAAQQIFADNGYRPVVKSVLQANARKYPSRPGLFTIDQLGLGGWSKVQPQFFDPDKGILAAVEHQVGGVTG